MLKRGHEIGLAHIRFSPTGETNPASRSGRNAQRSGFSLRTVFRPDGDAVQLGALASVLVLSSLRGRDPQVGDLAAIAYIADLWNLAQVADQDDFAEVSCHMDFLVCCLSSCSH